MTLTLFSAIMAMVLFTVTCTICSLILPKAKDRHLWIFALVFVLCILRCLIPVELNKAINVNCWKIYPELYALLKRELFWGMTIGSVLCIIWGIGTLFLLIRLGGELFFQYHLVKASDKAPKHPHLHHVATLAAGSFSRPITVNVYTTPDYAYPIMIGFFRPIILLPESCASFSDEEIIYILKHEIGHFLGCDLWIKLVIRLFICVMWWNPAVYLLKRSTDQLLELRCDRIACRSMTDSERADYTAVLLQVLHTDNFSTPKAISAGFAGHSNNAFFKQRVNILLSSVSPRTSRRLTITTIAICLLLYVGSYTFIFQPAALPPIDEEYQMVIVSPENAYLILTDEGNYEIWVDGAYYTTITATSITLPPFNELPIKNK